MIDRHLNVCIMYKMYVRIMFVLCVCMYMYMCVLYLFVHMYGVCVFGYISGIGPYTFKTTYSGKRDTHTWYIVCAGML